MNIRLRHDAIVRVLRREGTSTISDLADEVGASRRTVLRDIVALRNQGFVIHSESGRGGGLQLDPKSVQTTARLSVTEVFALLISVAAMRAARSLPFSDLADAGLAKIERALSADKVRDLRRLLDCLYVGQLSPKQDISNLGSIDPELLPAFEAAFLQQLHLRFGYRDAKEVETVRKVEPQAILILPPVWYLVAWDAAREGFRHFRMDRISRPEIIASTQFRRRHVPFEDDVCPFNEIPR
ncbi:MULTISPECIES: helix-turn-helix transcriptional regulator [unclassified Mesorhizobium]|uniref:helix-turn-helix transcriptional regulator n=1 Tax=unclassified Mesorhizobium TaxID=325217 RepID=UPI001125F759|nr:MULTISPECIES: WYL domain-containing protein [unclassified Mesorhizobium]MBZ9701760.1 WYL domain-containing protein [Mesorhizobium sp. CO1-1-3]MBZ9949108.1 WYL domain-containing protein [Mesorhizobium sp. BR1-1-11]TPI99683.1 WYL domain-containing protein [Mesorhizobium sp. B2-8-1]